MPPESGFLVGLPEGAQFTNHLGTVHASALVAVAEAGSGAFLVRLFGDVFGVVPVVRQLDAKFRRPATGRVMARANVDADLGKKWMTDVAERWRRCPLKWSMRPVTLCSPPAFSGSLRGRSESRAGIARPDQSPARGGDDVSHDIGGEDGLVAGHGCIQLCRRRKLLDGRRHLCGVTGE